MGNEHKDIKITPNTSQSAKPKIEVTGADNAVKTLTINDDGSITFDSTLTVSDLTVSGTTTTLNTATMTVEDKNIVLGSGNATSEVVDATGITLEGGSGDDITFQYNATDNRMELKHGSAFEDLKAGTVTGTFVGDITGDVTGNVSGSAATVTGAAQSAITSLGTLTSLTGGTGDLIWDTNTLVVDSSENKVGIATTSPTSTLHVTGDITASAEIQGSQFRLSGAANRIGLPATNEIGIFTDSTERVRIDDIGRVGIGTTDPVSPLHIDHNVSNPSTDAPNSFGIWIDADLSGSTATGGDREQGGIYVDLDTSATGGDSSDEHRPYGVWADVRVNSESDADAVYGIYGYTEAQRSGATGATTGVMRGGYFFAGTDETSDHTVTELTGSLGYASVQDAGTVGTAHGLRGFTNVNSSRSTNVGNLRGVSAEIDISGGRTDGSDITTGDSAVFRALLDHNPAASGEGTVTVANSYLYYGVTSITDSSQVTNNFGLYLSGEDKNYFSGSVGIGVSAPTDTLAVSGGIKIGEFNSTDGTGYAGTSPPSDHNNATGASDPQIRVAGRTSDQPGIIQMAFFDANNFFGGTGEFTLGRLQYAMNENSNSVTTVAEIRGITSDPQTAGNFDGALKFLTSQGDASSANLTTKMILTSDGYLGIGTTSPDGQLHISSGNSGDCTVIIEADEDNNAEGDLPRLWFKADGGINEGAVQLSDNELDIISNSATASGIRFLTGSTSNTGTTDPATGAAVRMDLTDNGLRIGSGARVTTINTGFSDNDTSLMTSAAINDRIESFGYITSQMTFVLEDDDGTEVSISNAEEIKFHSGNTSIDINYSDISPGSDADPFDLDFRTLFAPYLRTSDDRDFAPEDLDNTIRELSGRFSTKTGLEDGSTTNASDYVDALVLDTFTGHSGGDANLLAFAKNSTKRIYHYRADQDATNWGTASTIAYTSDIADLTVSDLAASAVVTESEGIGSNDNDTTLPTSAAVKDYVDNNAGGSVGGSDTELLYNDGGTENGIASLTWTDTAGSEQLKLTDESDTALFKIEQTGTGNVFEAHDQASDSNIFKIDNAGKTVIGASSSSTAHSAFFLYVNGDTRLSRLRVGTGSNTEPGVHFEGDTNTGIRRTAADQLGFITGGSERLSVGSSGEILIGGSAAGTSGQVLTSGGSGAAPTWEDASSGGVTLTGSTNDQLVTVTGSNAIQGESNLTLSSAGDLALTGTMTMTDTASNNTTPVLTVEQNRTDNNAILAKFIGNGNEVLHIKNSGHLHWELSTNGGDSDEVLMSYNDTAGSERNFMMIDQGTVVLNNRGPNGDIEIRANTSTAGGTGEVSVANFQDNRIILNQNVGIGTTSPDALLHVSSGTSGDAGIIIEADIDNNNEGDLPFMWFKQDGDITVHAIQATSNRLQIINNISASGGIDFALGTTNNTGTTDPSTGTTTALSIESDGGVQARKTVIKTVSTNTTLADEDSGKTIYWTGGTLTLPATAQSGQQFVVINNKGSSATPGLGTSNSIQTGWTAHAAMDDETARTYIAVAANKWIYIG